MALSDEHLELRWVPLTDDGQLDLTTLPQLLDGAKAFAPACTREVTKGPDGETWIVRHPDGGFRRFVLIEGGSRIATADGAEEVRAERVGADLEVRVAGNRYLFPAAPEPRTGASDAPAS